jgi:hypothetical protein
VRLTGSAAQRGAKNRAAWYSSAQRVRAVKRALINTDGILVTLNPMAQHTVKLTAIPELEVGNKDMRFDIEDDESGKIGTLLISRGGIEWRPHKKQKRHLSWERFDQIIRLHWGD